MRISVNGEALEVGAATLAALLAEIGYGDTVVATALNRDFVRVVDRETTTLHDGDAIEIVSPRQGG